ncbi:MAG: hypothetical protein KDC49_07400 [Saprospiraceae bacterium]|nr:hypothetical protein [Saprospiraceae bacterium]
MNKYLLLLVGLLVYSSISTQSVIGGWESYHKSPDGIDLRSVVIFADGYQAIASFDAKTGKFISCNGGTWKLVGDVMTEKVEFDSKKPERVGEEVTFKIELSEDHLSIVGTDRKFDRMDDGTPGKLSGAWLMSGRIQDGEVQSRDTSGSRKTMKILSGTRFQWIAYNTETKQFNGTGGGNYTTIDGKYTENIEFFSRDDSRVGASLVFDYKLVDGKWHHSGLSSKGDPIYEIWSIREK